MITEQVDSNDLFPLQCPTVSSSRLNNLEFGDMVYTWTIDPKIYELTGMIITPTKECHPDRPYVIHILGQDYSRYRSKIRTVSEHIKILRRRQGGRASRNPRRPSHCLTPGGNRPSANGIEEGPKAEPTQANHGNTQEEQQTVTEAHVRPRHKYVHQKHLITQEEAAMVPFTASPFHLHHSSTTRISMIQTTRLLRTSSHIISYLISGLTVRRFQITIMDRTVLSSSLP